MNNEKMSNELIKKENRGLEQQLENIGEFKKKIKDEFNRLKNLSDAQCSQTEIDRVTIGLLPAGVFAKELGIDLDIEDMMAEVRNTSTPLNPESRSDLGMAISSVEYIDYKRYFGDLASPHAREIKDVSTDFDCFLKALYVSKTSGRAIEIPTEIKEQLLQIGKTSLEKFESIDKITNEYEFMHLKSVSIGILALAKEFKDFKVPKKIIDSLYVKIKDFEKKNIVKWPHSENRIFITKIILSILNEKYLDQSEQK